MTETTLPTWDLTDFYDAPLCETMKSDLASVEALCNAFRGTYERHLPNLSSSKLSNAIAEYEQIQELIHKLYSYAQLLYATNMDDESITAFYQNLMETLNRESLKILFFTLEINELEDDEMDAHIKENAQVRRYAPFLRDVRLMKPYQLCEEVEEVLHEKSVTGSSAWIRLFDETMSSLTFPFEKEKLTNAEIFDKFSSHEEDERRKAAKSIGKVLKENIRTFAFITNTLAKDKAIENGWRGFKTPISARNVSNLVEDEVVDNLINSVKGRYGDLSHRYYRLKAKWLGKKKLNYWDRNAPLPEEDTTRYSWEEAKEIVLASYAGFSPELAELANKFFTNDWIDAAPKHGKDSGAFAHPTVPSVHPYLLVNFQGKSRDVMTLAHEVGHGVHQLLAAKQGMLMSETPLTLAETASVFSEQLTFQKLLKYADKDSQKVLIAGKVEDMLNTVVRQIAFCEFEAVLHSRRQYTELSVKDISEIWMVTQKASLGDAFTFAPEYQYYWSYIPHFIHSPFYVYAYAFGDCLVNALYSVYDEATDKKAFVAKYITMLEAGGTLHHRELLAPFGLDASHPHFWNKGLDVIAELIDVLEE